MKLKKTELKQMIRESVIKELSNKNKIGTMRKKQNENIDRIIKEEISKAKKKTLREGRGSLANYLPFVVEEFNQVYDLDPKQVEEHIENVFKSKNYKDFLTRIAYDLCHACNKAFGYKEWQEMYDKEQPNDAQIATLLKQGLKDSNIYQFVNKVMSLQESVEDYEQEEIPSDENILYNLRLYAWNTRYIYDKIENLIKSLNKKDESVLNIDTLANSFVMKKIVADCVKEGQYQKFIKPQVRKQFAYELAEEILDRKNEWK